MHRRTKRTFLIGGFELSRQPPPPVLGLLRLVAGIICRCCVVACQNYVDEKPGLESFKSLVSAKRRLKRWTDC